MAPFDMAAHRYYRGIDPTATIGNSARLASFGGGDRRDRARRDALLGSVAYRLVSTAGLTVTHAQARRLSGLSDEVSHRIVQELAAQGSLRHAGDGVYEVVR